MLTVFKNSLNCNVKALLRIEKEINITDTIFLFLNFFE